VGLLFQGWYGLARVLVAGVLGYVALVFFLRASGKRTLSKMNAFDLVVTVALGSSFGTVLLSKQVAILEGVLAFGLLVGLQYAVAWASVRSRRVERAVKSQPTLVFFRGEFLRATLRQERVTESEIRAALREQGYGSLAEVEAVVLATAGELSVIRKRGPEGDDTMSDVHGAKGP